jgi:hypothetical protein
MLAVSKNTHRKLLKKISDARRAKIDELVSGWMSVSFWVLDGLDLTTQDPEPKTKERGERHSDGR